MSRSIVVYATVIYVFFPSALHSPQQHSICVYATCMQMTFSPFVHFSGLVLPPQRLQTTTTLPFTFAATAATVVVVNSADKHTNLRSELIFCSIRHSFVQPHKMPTHTILSDSSLGAGKRTTDSGEMEHRRWSVPSASEAIRTFLRKLPRAISIKLDFQV